MKRLVTRLLLWLAPRSFRRRYGEEMADVLDSERVTAVVFKDLLARRRCGFDVVNSCARSVGGPVRRAPRLPQPSKRTEMETMFQDLRFALRQFIRSSRLHGDRGALARAGDRRKQPDLRDARRIRLPPVPRTRIPIGSSPSASRSRSSRRRRPTSRRCRRPSTRDIRTTRGFGASASFDLGNRNISGGDVPERVFTALLLDDLFPVVGMSAGARTRLHRGGARAERAAGRRSSAIDSGRPGSAAIPAS